MTYREAIRDLITDEEGNYKVGLEHAVTPEDVLEYMGVEYDDRGDKQYQQCRVELNAVMTQANREGYQAGGISRAPTHYFIAKDPSEQRLLIASRSGNNIGRLQNMAYRGRGVMNTRKLTQVIALLSKFEEPDDDYNLLLDYLGDDEEGQEIEQ
jgi:hypothetical protein